MSEIHFNKEKGSQIKLFTPGPVYVPERILAEMAKPNDTHRSKPYEEMHQIATEGLQKLLYTKNDCLIFTSSATGIMEACVRNLIGDDEKKRTVSRVVSGIDEMYEVSQTHGNSYVVNSIHILTLVNSKGEVIDIQIQDYLKRNLDEQKKLFGFKVESGKKILSEIKIKSVGRGPYCGWYIDGNERFLLGDYTVTHNTRDMGGKDAADARYAETKPEWWIPYVFRREDLPILELKEDEGEEIEPVSFYPILPTVLINGCNGIALAYSTFIPNHNPIDVINWLKAKIEGKSLPLLKPWYRGFSGSIEVIDRRTKTRKRRAKQLAVPEERVSDIPDPEPPTIPSLSEFNDNEQDTITTSEEEQNNDEPDFMKEIA